MIKVLVVVKKIPSTFLNYWFNFSVHFIALFASKTVNKRLGYILEILEIEPAIQEYLYENIGKSHTLLDPTISDHGIFVSKWNLYANIDRDSLLSSLYT